MSPRRNSRSAEGREVRSAGGWYLERTESYRGEDWKVRPVDGGSGKSYRCPGCDQEIRPGVGHVVAWPEYAGVDDRRHWHTACWNARERRGASVLRGRGAPRY